MSSDKDIKGVCRVFSDIADEFVVTRADAARAADPLVIRGYIDSKEVSVTEDVKEALGIAFSKAKRDDLILATGSFYLIGEIRDLIVDSNQLSAFSRQLIAES